jgi:hypothetical protein
MNTRLTNCLLHESKVKNLLKTKTVFCIHLQNFLLIFTSYEYESLVFVSYKLLIKNLNRIVKNCLVLYDPLVALMKLDCVTGSFRCRNDSCVFRAGTADVTMLGVVPWLRAKRTMPGRGEKNWGVARV